MEEWWLEFRFWRTEQEEYEEFAQTLCSEFQNWRTPAEEVIEYRDQFLSTYFTELPVDVIKLIRTKFVKSISKNWCRRLLPFGAGQLPRQSQRILRDLHNRVYQNRCNCWERSCRYC